MRAALLAIVGILLLMWPALVNRQPFYFSDTSSYVRAGGAAVRLLVPGARTIWTRPDTLAAPAAPAAAPGPTAPAAEARGNDPASGYIMAGRSPYFGILLWLGWVTSHFWLFVVAQALIAWLLIGMALRCFGEERASVRLGVAAALAFLSPLAAFNGLLLADALSGFGIAAFLILATPRVRLAGWERVLLALVLIVSVISHLTHLVMLGGMVALLLVLGRASRRPWRELRAPLLIGVAALLIGAFSTFVTARVVEARFGKPPVLVPLLTARFIADGPGRAYIEAGCEGRRFTVCRIPYRGWTESAEFLWSRDPARGAFMPLDAEMRRRLSVEDKPFALAVARAYPLPVLRLVAWNSLLQFADLRVEIVNESCYATPSCIGEQFPPAIVRQIAATPGGRGAWPVPLMDAIVYAAAFASLIGFAIMLPALHRRDPHLARLAIGWGAMILLTLTINAVLGGAISEPQSRYQARLAWLVPLLASILLLARLRVSERGSAVAAGRQAPQGHPPQQQPGDE